MCDVCDECLGVLVRLHVRVLLFLAGMSARVFIATSTETRERRKLWLRRGCRRVLVGFQNSTPQQDQLVCYDVGAFSRNKAVLLLTHFGVVPFADGVPLDAFFRLAGLLLAESRCGVAWCFRVGKHNGMAQGAFRPSPFCPRQR